MKPAPMTIDELRQTLAYREDGNLVWLQHRPGVVPGTVAGCVKKGYVNVGLSGKSYLAHRLVWFLKTGEWPNELINHINGKKSDNRIENLEISNTQHNTLHAYRHGLRRADGERNGRALITREQVHEILRSKSTRAELAVVYGIAKGTVNDILLGRTWKSVRLELEA